MTTETATPAAAAPAEKPAEAAPEARPLFGPTGDGKAPAEKEKPAAEVKPEEKPAEDAAKVEQQAQEERAAQVRARFARERSELEAQRQEVASARKELEEARALKATLDKYKEDPLLLLEQFGHKFEDVSKRALAAPRTDPRTLELKAEVESTKSELAKFREEAQSREVQKTIAEEHGRIAATLETEDFKHARRMGWTPQRVWSEMEAVFRATGKLPTRQDVLDLVKKTETDRRQQILDDAIAAGEVVKPAPKPVPGAKKPAPAKTITSQDSAPPVKVAAKLTLEEKLANALRERPLFDGK